MKKILLFVSFVIVSSGLFSLSFLKEMRLSDTQLENIEALADGEGGGSGCGGYRSWNTSGFLQHKKEFYDCRCILRQGYSPQGNC